MRFAPAFKLALHKELSEYLNRNFVAPINVEISLTGKCNASCPWCFYRDNRDNEELEYKVVLRLMDELKSMGTKAISWTGGGEPTLYSKFKEVSDYCNKQGIKQGLFTNALAKIDYSPKNFEWVRVSKTNNDWNVDNFNKLRECKTFGLCINYLGDEEEVKNALKIAHKYKLDYVQVRPALKGDGEKTFIKPIEVKDNLLLLTDYKFKEAKKDKAYGLCEGYHFVPFIWQNGDIDVCAYHKGNKNFNLGNIYKDSIIEIMSNAPESVKVVPECQICCKNHEINKFISKLREIEDIDFV